MAGWQNREDKARSLNVTKITRKRLVQDVSTVRGGFEEKTSRVGDLREAME